MNVKKSLESRIRGWLPKEPLLKGHATVGQAKNKVESELEQELTKNLIKAIAITNPIVGAVFLTSNPYTGWGLSWVTMVSVFAELFLVLLASDVLIYLFLKHRILGGRV